MDKIFAEIFAKQPDEIINGDYFFHTWYGGEMDKMVTHRYPERLLKEFYEERERTIKETFKDLWETCICQGEFNPDVDSYWLENMKGKNNDFLFEKIINKIALENKPFMDIASSNTMGLASYIVKMNPPIPCLVTDINAHDIKCLRPCVDKYLAECNINLASFDNFDIPIKDNSLDYITGIGGIGSTCSNPSDGVPSGGWQSFVKKVIHEVYRILKPGGCFITLERTTECNFDLQKIYNDCNEHGKLFGIYTYDEIQAALEIMTEETPWRDNFISAGFQVEFENKNLQGYSLNELKRFLYSVTNYKIREWTNEEKALYSVSKIRGIPSKQTIEEMLKDETLSEKINSLGVLRKIENNRTKTLSADEIKDILLNYIKSDKPNEYTSIIDDRNDDEADDIGIDFYETNTFYILRKPDMVP